MTIVIDKDVALGALVGVIEKFGVEHVYDSDGLGGCWYVVHDENGQPEPACLVGQVLWGLGVDPSILEEMNDSGPINTHGNLDLLERAGVEIHVEAVAILRRAQCTQDIGGDWGTALSQAQEVYQALAK